MERSIIDHCFFLIIPFSILIKTAVYILNGIDARTPCEPYEMLKLYAYFNNRTITGWLRT